MQIYNESDVRALEELYLMIRPWIKGHPPVGLYIDAEGVTACGNCGNTELEWGGKYFTPAGRYKAFRCKCGAIGRDRTSDLTKEERAALCLSVAN
jgi:hypothetical protein